MLEHELTSIVKDYFIGLVGQCMIDKSLSNYCLAYHQKAVTQAQIDEYSFSHSFCVLWQTAEVFKRELLAAAKNSSW